MPEATLYATIYYILSATDGGIDRLIGLTNVPLEYVSEKLIAIAAQGHTPVKVYFTDHLRADTVELNLPITVT